MSVRRYGTSRSSWAAVLLVAALGVFAAAQLAGCPSSERTCSDDSDCFVGERCTDDGSCAPIPTITADGGSDAGSDDANSETRDTDTGRDTDSRIPDADTGRPPPRDTDDSTPDTTDDADTVEDTAADATVDAPPTGPPRPGAGRIVWKHDFSNGMPPAFDHSADYPNSGTWGRNHELDGGDIYEPATIDGDHLRLDGPHCSSQGAAYPTTVDRDLQNWELHYRVAATPGTDGHSNRATGGIGAVGAQPKGNYADDIDQLSRGTTGFVDKGDAFELEGWTSPQNRVERRKNIDVSIASGEWYVRIATSKRRAKTWVKFWPSDASEPSDWNLEFDAYLSGRPGFYVQGSCKPNAPDRRNAYRFYELREIAP